MLHLIARDHDGLTVDHGLGRHPVFVRTGNGKGTQICRGCGYEVGIHLRMGGYLEALGMLKADTDFVPLHRHTLIEGSGAFELLPVDILPCGEGQSVSHVHLVAGMDVGGLTDIDGDSHFRIGDFQGA